MLTGPQTSPSFQRVQAYDPSGIMLQQSEKDLEALAKFSGTLGGILKKKGEEIKEETIGKGFTKFITGEIVFNPDTGEFNAKEEAVRTGARNATAIAEAAECMPGGTRNVCSNTTDISSYSWTRSYGGIKSNGSECSYILYYLCSNSKE